MNPKLPLGLIASAILLTTSTPANAGPRYDAKLSIGYSKSGGGQFAGHLRSHGGCVAGRKVAVYRKGPGTDPSIGSGTVSAAGRWSASSSGISAGDYYAKTPTVKTSAGLCAAAKSATTRVS